MALQQLMSVQLEDVMTPRHVTEDLLVDPELDPVNFLSLIVESLATLKKLPQAIDVCGTCNADTMYLLFFVPYIK